MTRREALRAALRAFWPRTGTRRPPTAQQGHSGAPDPFTRNQEDSRP